MFKKDYSDWYYKKATNGYEINYAVYFLGFKFYRTFGYYKITADEGGMKFFEHKNLNELINIYLNETA